MTIEIVDTSVIQVSARKSDTRTQFGISDTHGRNSGAGFQSEPLLLAAAQTDETDLPVTKSQWIQTKGPGGISGAGLFLASDQTLYAIAKTGLYRLSETEDAWTLVSTSGPNREFNPVMAERDGTLYLLTPNELLVSIDEGKTWNSLGKRPEGRARALTITDTAMYLVLQTEVFRSEDVGNLWEPIGKDLRADNVPEAGAPDFSIWDALAVDNTLFIGTSQGLFRFTDEWRKLPVPTSHGINSLVTAEDRLYVGTIALPPQGPHAAVFYSTDFGNSWTDITPNTHEHPVKILTAVEVVAVGNTLMLKSPLGVLLSDDGGETWTDPNPGPHTFGAFPIVVLDQNTFYGTDRSGIKRSTDGGITWHPFTAGLVNSNVPNLFVFENVLYALTPTEMLKSADGGESWQPVSLIDANKKVSLESAQAKVATANGVLYVSDSELDGVTLFRLSDTGDVFLPVKGVPDFEEDTSHTGRLKKSMEAATNDAGINKAREVLRANQERIIEEWRTNGTMTCTNDTLFMEYGRKLFRWRRGETAWHNTGFGGSGGDFTY